MTLDDELVRAVDEVINTWLHSGGKYDLVSMADPLVELFLNGIGNIGETIVTSQ